jgi:hypothetical protein
MDSVKDSGTFDDVSCPRLLAHLHRTRFGGTLRITLGGTLKLLYFQSGEIAMASSNDPADHLAPILIRAGKLKQEQLDLARKSARPGTSLARVLVEMGFLTSGELFAGARQQLRQIVGSVLDLSGGGYEIQPGFFPREVTSLNVDTRELLLELVRALPDRSFILDEVGEPGSTYRPATDLAEAMTSMRLPRAWKDLAERFTAPRTIREVGEAVGMDDFTASKAVYGLHLLGLLERAPEPGNRREEEGQEESAGIAETTPADLDEPVPRAGADSESGPKGGSALAEDEAAPDDPGTGVIPSPAPEAAIPGTLEAADPEIPGFPAPGPVVPPPRGGEELVAGERPIRLEFTGTPAAHRRQPPRRSGAWGVVSIFLGLMLLGGAFAWFVLLRPAPGPSSPAPAQPEAPALSDGSDGLPERADGAQAGTPPQDGPAPATSEIAEAAPIGEPGVEPAGATPPTAPPGAEGTAGTLPAESLPTGSQVPHPPEAPAPENAPGNSGFSAAQRFVAARRLLDRGEIAGAADAWRGVVGDESILGFTLQIAIACQEETIRRAAEKTRGSTRFFTVPFDLGGRPCYRLCWGGYRSEPEAQAAKAGVPEFFLAEGGRPMVVSLGKLGPGKER